MADGDEIVVIRGRRHVVWDCGNCGVVYTVPEVKNDSMRSNGGYAHCPNGHMWGWREGQKQRDDLRLERDRLKQEQARLIDERNAALKAAEEAKQSERRLKKRVKNGTCPCCKRTFSNMQEHMSKMHPEFVGPKPKVMPLPN